jgi:hypothetical protein
MSQLIEQALLSVVAQNAESLSHREKVAYIVQQLEKIEQAPCPVNHYFAPGVYVREVFMKAGLVVIGKIHKTEHINIIECGRVSIVHADGTTEQYAAPYTFVSKAGVQKVLYIHEDTLWKTVHVTDERNLETLEALLIEKPPVVELTHSPAEQLQ